MSGSFSARDCSSYRLHAGSHYVAAQLGPASHRSLIRDVRPGPCCCAHAVLLRYGATIT